VNHLTAELADALRETEVVSRHLHVPLQSGDDAVLAAMGRRYDAATYRRRLRLVSDFNVTTDVIVGFPDEDETAFARTLALVRETGISRAHVFPYSPRPGTRTADRDAVPPAVKKDRSERVRALSDVAQRRLWQTKVGARDDVLVDRPGRGYGDDYVPWLVDGCVGEIVHVTGRAVTEQGVVAA
jgi:threonylcarbamoyladenosine tRNA methylthiotransferase MtaB